MEEEGQIREEWRREGGAGKAGRGEGVHTAFYFLFGSHSLSAPDS